MSISEKRSISTLHLAYISLHIYAATGTATATPMEPPVPVFNVSIPSI